MSLTILDSTSIDGTLVVSSIANATVDTDKFLVSDSGILKYRTGAQVRSDIGAGTGNGTVTSVGVSAGAGLSGGGTVTTSGTISLALDLGELGIGGTLVGTDYIIAENGGVDNKQLVSSIPLSIFNNNSGWTSNTGTVTSVGGTGTVSGLTLSGTVTSSGNLTLGGTLALTSANVTTALGYTPYNSTNPSGYTTNTGTVTSIGVAAGTGMSGGGTVTTAGTVTLTNADRGSSQNIFKNVAVSGQTSIVADSNNDTLTFAAGNNITLSTNAATDTLTITANINPGDITGVTASAPLTGGGTSGTVTVGISQSSDATDGYLSAADWGTFNSKTSNTGTVTSVGGTGTVSGLTLSGTVTGSGNLTLGGTLALTSANVTGALGYTPYNATNPSGYTTNTGTVTSVGISHAGDAFTAGSAVTTSGTLAITMAGTEEQYINGLGNLVAFPAIPQGDITAVVAGTGLSGGGTSGSVTLTNAAPNVTTNLSTTTTATTLTVVSSDGTNAILPAATTTVAGVMTGADKSKLDGIAAGATNVTNNNQLTNGAGYTTNTGTTTASNTQTFTNKSGNISQWTNDSGYTTNVGDITGVTAGTGISGGGTSGTVTITNSDGGSSQNIFKNVAVSGQTSIVADSNNDTLTFAAGSNITLTTDAATDTLTITANINPGDITGVTAGTGLSGGGTSGTVTLNIDSTVATLTGTQTFTNKSGNISQWTNDSGYTTNVGDITGVTAGAGISGGGTSGTVTITNSDKGSSQNIFKRFEFEGILIEAGSNDDGITFNPGSNVSFATDPATKTVTISATSNPGDITGVTAGTGLSGGGTSGTVTLTNAAPNVTTNLSTTTAATTVTIVSSDGTDATIPAATIGAAGVMTGVDKAKLDGIAAGATNVTNNNQLTNGAGYTTNTGTTTASNTQTFTNKSGAISQWTNDSGYTTNVGDITGVTAGTGLSGGGTSGTVTLTNAAPNVTTNLSTTTAATTVTVNSSDGTDATIPAATASVAGVMTGADKSKLDGIAAGATNVTNNNQLVNGAGYTTNVGDITGVTAGAGISGGGTSGTVTITNSDKGSAQNIFKRFEFEGILIEAESNDDGITFNPGSNVSFATDPATKTVTISATSNPGDITGVVAGTGLSGGGTSGTVTLTNSAPNVSTNLTTTTAATTLTVNSSDGTNAILPAATTTVAGVMTGADKSKLDGIAAGATNVTNNNQLTNGAGYTTNTGDITSVGVGNGLTGGGTSGAVTVSMSGSYTGNFTATQNITAYSDERLKTNIETIPNALEKVNSLRGVTFDKDGVRGLGVIAQEVEKILPEVVIEGEEYKSVAYGNIVGVLIEAIKELTNEVEELKRKLN